MIWGAHLSATRQSNPIRRGVCGFHKNLRIPLATAMSFAHDYMVNRLSPPKSSDTLFPLHPACKKRFGKAGCEISSPKLLEPLHLCGGTSPCESGVALRSRFTRGLPDR